MDDARGSGADASQAAAYRYGDELSPSSTLLVELLKEAQFSELFEACYALLGIPVAIIDLKANVLSSSRWQPLCTRFHRVHPATCARCVASDVAIGAYLAEGHELVVRPCENGLTDCAAPILIEGEDYVANLFIGQFFTAPPDEARFRRQAEEFGFDEAEYMEAVRAVPVVSASRIEAILSFLQRLTRVTTNLFLDRRRATALQERQSIIVNTIPQAVFWKGRDGRYLGCNAAFAELAGLESVEDIAGKTDFDLPWLPDEAAAYRAVDQDVMERGEALLHLIEEVHKRDGTNAILDTCKIPLQGPDRVTRGVLGISEDVTEDLRQREELRRSQELFRTAFMTGLDAIYIATVREGRIVDVNEEFTSVFGYERPEVLGKTSRELGFWADRAERARIIEQVRERGFVRDAEIWAVKKGGERFRASISMRLMNDLGDEPHTLSVVRDVTQMRRAQEEQESLQAQLRVGEQRFRTMVEKAPAAVAVSRDGRVLYVNETFRTQFRVGAGSEVVGLRVEELWCPAERAGLAERTRMRLAGQPVSALYQGRACRFDGSEFPAEMSLEDVELPDGLATMAFITDVTERKLYETRIELLNRMHALVSTVNEAIVRERDPVRLLEQACRTAVERGGFRMAWVGILDPTTEELHPTAHAGFTDGYLDRVHIRMRDPLMSGGATGRALRTGMHQVSNDIASDPPMAPWREDALRRGYRASAAFPLRVDGEVVGVINLYSETAGHFDTRELALLDQLALDLGFAIEALRRREEQQQTQQALAESEQRFRQIAENIDEVFWMIDPRTRRTLYVSPAFERIWGRPLDSAYDSASSWLAPVHPDDRARVFQALEGDLLEGKYDVEYRIVRPDGSVRSIHDRGYVIRDEHGEPVRVVGTASDVTERQQAQAAVRESEEKFRAVFKNNPDALYVATLHDGRIEAVNDAFVELWGYAREEVIGKTSTELGMYADPRVRAGIVAELRSHGRVSNFETGGRKKSGELCMMSLSMMVVPIGDEPRIVGAIKDVTEARIAAETLKDSREQYRRLEAVLRAVFDSTDDLIWAVDAKDFRIIELNHAMNEYFARRIGLESALGLSPSDIFGEGSDFARTWLGFFERALREGAFVVEEYRTSAGGLTLELHFGLLRRDGEVFGISAFGRNITARAQAEAELRRSEARFRGIFDESPLGIVSSRGEKVLFCNPAMARQLGYSSPDELAGRSIEELVTPESARVMGDRQRARVAGDALPAGYEIDGIRRDGSVIPAYMHVSRWELPDGPATLAFFEDLTAKREAEAERLLVESRFRAIFHASPVGVGISREGRTIMVNPAYAHMFGHEEPEALVGKPIAEFLAPESRELVLTRQRARIAGESPPPDYEITGLRRDGTPFPAHMRVLVVQLPDGPASLAFFDDLTEERRAAEEQARTEAQLRHAQQMEAIGTLAAGFAHDFNNVLAPVLGGAELALEALPPDSPAREEIGSIETAARRAQELVRQILLLSRAEQDTQRAPVEMIRLVKETVRLVRAGLPATISIQSELPPSCPTVLGNATALHQVLLNLCTNARDAMGSAGTLTIRLREAGPEDEVPPPSTRAGEELPWLLLTVTDTGSGMTPEVQRRIFEPYFTTKPRGKGTGLGLSVTHGIITSMGGEIRVRSALGEGTTFEILLPAAGRIAAAERARPLVPRGNGERILVIDDEVAVRGVMVRILRSLGYTAAEVEEPEAVLALVRSAETRLDAIIMDQTMPGMTGVELARACLGLRPDLPIVLCTGDAEIAEAARTGVHCVLPKPFTIQSVAEALHGALSGEGVAAAGSS